MSPNCQRAYRPGLLDQGRFRYLPGGVSLVRVGHYALSGRSQPHFPAVLFQKFNAEFIGQAP